MPERRSLRQWLEESWYQARPLRALLPLSFLYGVVLAVRSACHRLGWQRPRQLDVPVVVIGNLTAGGTGKTPLVIWLAQQLQDAGRRPGVVLRGHGGSQREPHRLRTGDGPEQVGDEAVLIAARTQCPVAVGARRAPAAQLLVEAGCDLILSDDGLHHLALARDLEVLVIDGARGFGNGALLPAGPLRSRESAWREGRVIVMHGVDLHRVVPATAQALQMQLAALSLREVASGREHPLARLRGTTVHAVAGIGHPRRFFELLRSLGALPIAHAFADHHAFRATDLPAPDGHPVVMTEKDAVKCRALAAGRDDVFSLVVTAQLPQADAARLLGRVLALQRN